jgi:NADH dehydrogenase (ubiquinone) Fe-S protein 3
LVLTLRQYAPRDPPAKLKVPILNPADKYHEKAEALHKYGQYIMSCLPKYIQQYAFFGCQLPSIILTRPGSRSGKTN